MIIALIAAVFFVTLLLVLTTYVQNLYLESLRLRTRDLPSLVYFREVLQDRIGLKVENGALTFSLIKHSLLGLLGILIVGVTAIHETLTGSSLLEAVAFYWIIMMLSGYIAPQFLYRRTSGRWLLTLAPVLKVLALVVRPLTALLGLLQSLSELGQPGPVSEEPTTPEENIEALITAGTEEGLIAEEDRRLIQSVVAFGDKTVREVMTPRPAIVSISRDCGLEDLRQLVIHEQFSRVPVHEGDIDHIAGFVHVRDMFELDHTERVQRKVGELVRPIRLVPESKRVNDLLREMQQDGAHMAIVVDEYGNTAGLVTMEDMVEEIVGEIRDEHEPALDVKEDAEGGFIVSGSFDVDHLQELVGFRPTDANESTTVGGLVTEWMGRVPQPGESIDRDGIRIEVLAGNELRVEQVRVSRAETVANG
jgi:CBS domain containing-hemolysin-like protein